MSLIGFNENALAFKYVNSSSTTLNYLLITLKDFGAAKISRSLLILLDYSSYLIPIFFLIIGIKLVIGIKYKNLFGHIISLFIGLCLLNFSLAFVNIKTGLLGSLLFDMTKYFLQVDIFRCVAFC